MTAEVEIPWHLDDDSHWSRETFWTEAEAKGFAYGLTYGDEPQYEVDVVEPCRHVDGWDVVFRLMEDL